MFIVVQTIQKGFPGFAGKTKKTFLNLKNILRIDVVENNVEFYTITKPHALAYSVKFDSHQDATTFVNTLYPKMVLTSSLPKSKDAFQMSQPQPDLSYLQ